MLWLQRAMVSDASQRGVAWDLHTGFKTIAARQGPAPLAALLRQKMALQQQVRPELALAWAQEPASLALWPAWRSLCSIIFLIRL